MCIRDRLQCGIGTTDPSSSTAAAATAPIVVQHRALVFFQLKSMIDIVEKDLLKAKMPGVTYLRLDGSVPANERQGIVDKFNNDVSVDLLLISTAVGECACIIARLKEIPIFCSSEKYSVLPTGGLGLNLTGADTVIFVEHDWNPMKDLQAMDLSLIHI